MIPPLSIIQRIEALRVLGCTTAEKMPDVAIEAIEAGLDSKHLVEIAGLNKPAWRDLEPLWKAMLAELKLSPLSEIQATHIVVLPEAQAIARQFQSEALDVFSTLVALESLNFKYGHRRFLEHFCVLHDTWAYFVETYPDELSELKSEFLDEVKKLLAIPEYGAADASFSPEIFACYTK